MINMWMFSTSEYDITTSRESIKPLIFRIATGEHSALEELYSRTHASVYALALSYLKNAHDAQDVMQDTFVRVWEKAPEYRAIGSAMAWLLTICRNLSLMKLRSDARLTTLENEEWDAIPESSSAVTHEDRLLLQNVLEKLDAKERQIVLLHATSGLKHREIAILLKMPLSTVLSKYHRALKKMKALMEGDEIYE